MTALAAQLHEPIIDAARPGFALYIHWPFCRAKCPYCDFNSHVRERIDEARFRAALLSEIDHFAATTAGRLLTSIFFGGGTPSLMAAETVAALISRAQHHWNFAPDIEITLEANPNSAEAARFRDYAGAGVNRLSLGVQSFDDDALEFLGRLHGADEALSAIALAATTFPRFSFDLIYARPGQSESAWRDELNHALAFAGDHLSLYQLTIEENTGFERAVARGEFAPMDDNPAAALYEITREMMEAAGLPAYEISNYAKPKGESRHNLTYWRYGDYIGAGPGAHGRLGGDEGKAATRQIRAPEAWLEAVERSGHGIAEREELDAETRAAEMLMMGLRLTEGVREDSFALETGRTLDEALEPSRLAALIEGGYLERGDGNLRATASGRLRLNAVLARLLG